MIRISYGDALGLIDALRGKDAGDRELAAGRIEGMIAARKAEVAAELGPFRVTDLSDDEIARLAQLAQPRQLSDHELADRIREIMGSYRVCAMFANPTRTRRYGVWHGPVGSAQLVTIPVAHAEAQAQRIDMIITDLIDLMRGEG